MTIEDGATILTFDRLVTVKGAPALSYARGGRGRCLEGSGTNRLRFDSPRGAPRATPERLVFDLGAIIASEAVAQAICASPLLPAA